MGRGGVPEQAGPGRGEEGGSLNRAGLGDGKRGVPEQAGPGRREEGGS